MAGFSERYLHPMLRQTGFWVHKNQGGKFGQLGPDYAIAPWTVQIECKNTGRDGVLSDGPSDVQRRLLDEQGGFVFLVMWDEGLPRLPKGGDGYLVPWHVYREWWDRNSAIKGKSIRRHATTRAIGADEELGEYRLEWTDGHFHIPFAHKSGFWSVLRTKNTELSNFIQGIMQ